jgi:transposase
MPWATNTVVEARREFVTLAEAPGANVRVLCRKFDVSPKTAYKLLKRFRARGDQGLEDVSRRPLHGPSKTPERVERAVSSIRATHPQWGGRRIARELRVQGVIRVPAPSTITNILSRLGQRRSGDQFGTIASLSAMPSDRMVRFWRDQVPSVLDEGNLLVVLEHLIGKRVLERRRAMVILASWLGMRPSVVCRLLELSPTTHRRCLRIFADGGPAALFARRKNPHRKCDSETIKAALFDTLHQPPSNFRINRTTWKIADLSRVLADLGQPAGEEVIRSMIKAAGYKWRKARTVLTSSDPDFSQKLDRIKSILSALGPDEAFFSIDEFGPFAIKDQPGKSLVAPGEQRLVQQWQRSRGSIILTAAIELSSNQVSHFYSEKKNTSEIIRMMNLLIQQYKDLRRIYLSWDAASWHVSKELNLKIEEHNNAAIGPTVVIAPLPARAQFLNVIESVFSGMARAIIHNSNYRSPDEAKIAIDRYFDERNRHFREHPRKAGKKIWGKERVPPTFCQSNNCKDPRLG